MLQSNFTKLNKFAAGLNPEQANVIYEVLRSEELAKTKKVGNFDIFSWCSKSGYENRRFMKGVNHLNGYRFATDSKVLVRIREDYPEEFEGQCLSKSGELYADKEGLMRFGKDVEYVLDNARKNEQAVAFTQEALAEAVAEVKAEKKLNGIVPIDIAGTKFSDDVFLRVATFLKSFGVNELKAAPKNRAFYARAESAEIVFMPCIMGYDANVTLKCTVTE